MKCSKQNILLVLVTLERDLNYFAFFQTSLCLADHATIENIIILSFCKHVSSPHSMLNGQKSPPPPSLLTKTKLILPPVKLNSFKQFLNYTSLNIISNNKIGLINHPQCPQSMAPINQCVILGLKSTDYF